MKIDEISSETGLKHYPTVLNIRNKNTNWIVIKKNVEQITKKEYLLSFFLINLIKKENI
ncbi:hypothetical protein L1276_000594 [Flavobacterium sp. HSC-32F16]|nr:hypothetical protein [Flavobacterium sp. HSC-32F16]